MRILLVCTGNTCRSPMAEVLLRQRLLTLGLDDVEVGSAGTAAVAGVPASEGAYLVALEAGLDLSRHRARPLSPRLVGEADLILAMSRRHLHEVERLGGLGRTHLLGAFGGSGGEGEEIGDPFGGSVDDYRQTMDQLSGLVNRVADHLVQRRGDR